MVLKEGPMTMRELSVWFGLKPDSFAKSKLTTKQKKMEKLKNFCDFHLDEKKIIIDKVYIPEYSKAFDFIEERFDKEWGLVIDPKTYQANWQQEARVDTCVRVGKAMHHKYPEVKQVAESTAINYTNKVKTNKYGKTYKEDRGTQGSCEIVYLNQDETGLLSDTEMDILNSCRADAYRDIGIQMNKIDESKAMKEITADEAKEAKGQIDTTNAYEKYLELLIERLGFIPKKRTRLHDEIIFNS